MQLVWWTLITGKERSALVLFSIGTSTGLMLQFARRRNYQEVQCRWPPPKGVSGIIDQTRGLLDYVDKHCLKAVYTPELKYVCIAGRYIRGARIFKDSSEEIEYVAPYNDPELATVATMVDTTVSTSTSTSSRTTVRARVVGQGYTQVCVRADVWGDGVVPEESAHLKGAVNISFEGVYHSPVGSDDTSRPLCGSPAVVEKWINYLLDY